MESINKYRQKDLSFLKVLIPMILIVVGVVLFLNGSIGGKGSRQSFPNIPEPKQTEATGGTDFVVSGYNVHADYLYAYEIEALVVHTKNYYGSDFGTKLAPRDLALAWGSVAKYNNTVDFHWDQHGRWYFWQVNTYEELSTVGTVDDVNRQSSNNHLIAANSSVKKTIKKINTGDHIKLKGYLVNITATNSKGNPYYWNSSTSRSDTGNGACEVMYVTEATILR
ncbi:MAG: hypothetical protein IKO53_07090 [Lachnospiraceae bacterium]|nr:hypothetical protein [Lachnospiraceae bacterium]